MILILVKYCNLWYSYNGIEVSKMKFNPNEDDENFKEDIHSDYFHRVANGEDPDDADEDDFADDYYDRDDDDDDKDLVELEFNKRNREDYENLMQDSSTNLDGYWDKNNPAVRTLLLILGGIIVFGVSYYLIAFFTSR